MRDGGDGRMGMWWVIACNHTCTAYSVTEEARGLSNYRYNHYALTHIIIRYGLISYRSHSHCIMSNQGNKTQQEVSSDHTRKRDKKA